MRSANGDAKRRRGSSDADASGPARPRAPTGAPDEDDADDDEAGSGKAGLRVKPEDLSWRSAIRFVGARMLLHPWAIAGAFVMGVVLAFAEILTVGLVLPFLESLGGASLAGDTPLAFLVPYFEGMSVVERMRAIAIGLVVLQVFKSALGYGLNRIAAYMEVVVERDLRSDIFEQILAVDIKFIHRERIANLYTILHVYPSHASTMALEFMKGVPKAASFVGFLIALFLLSWQLTLVALTLAIVTTWAVGLLTHAVRRLSRRMNEARVELNQTSLETLQAMKLVRMYAREDHARGKYQRALNDMQGTQYKKSSIQALTSPVYSVLNTAMFALLIIGATFVLDRSDEAWVVLLTSFIFVMFRLLGPTTAYASRRSKLAGRLPSIEELVRFLDREGKPYLKDGTRDFTRLSRGIRLKRVRFRYAPDGEEVLKGLDLSIPKGSTVALVGGSGAGKTTIINLLARLDDPTSGSITIDGVDLRELRVASWRRRVAVVSQDTFLFNDTVLENIRYGRLDATDQEVFEAARVAGAHEFIDELPHGYATIVGDRAVRLSGGQAQRVAIARALLADPEVLVLDEATSALDTATERQVQEALELLARDRTVVAIAHRLSTVRKADLIVVLEDGRIVEQGTHHELLRAKGRYWTYVNMQDLVHDDGSGRPRRPARSASGAKQGAEKARRSRSPGGPRGGRGRAPE